ncbi:hypothetical protein E2C01_033130 [Portunus trituberculatus]|uniref:Uncharacterized protein n=1 Tax=Portunus trituberculatus TaxID=210409 RepID=A0A5B7F2Y5_PORTR|nr:hypothetical protein [Portunus trituberculatus]
MKSCCRRRSEESLCRPISGGPQGRCFAVRVYASSCASSSTSSSSPTFCRSPSHSGLGLLRLSRLAPPRLTFLSIIRRHSAKDATPEPRPVDHVRDVLVQTYGAVLSRLHHAVIRHQDDVDAGQKVPGLQPFDQPAYHLVHVGQLRVHLQASDGELVTRVSYYRSTDWKLMVGAKVGLGVTCGVSVHLSGTCTCSAPGKL